MIAVSLVLALLTVAAPAKGIALPTAPPGVSIVGLGHELAAYFHNVNHDLGKHVFVRYVVSTDGRNAAMMVEQADWESFPKPRRDAIVSKALTWWRTKCPKGGKYPCRLDVYDEAHTAISVKSPAP